MAKRTVFITGSGRGIGLELARVFLKQGFEVIATSRTLTPELESLAGATVFSLDVTGSMDALQAKASKLFPKALDILINNAGQLVNEPGFETLNPQVIEESFRVNTLGPVRVTQALMPWLKKSSRPVVASITSQMGSIADNSSGGYYAYRISKAALNMFNKSLSKDFPMMTCLVLHPGWVQTRMGGESAPVTVMDSASGLYRIISEATPNVSGKFLNFSGKELPW
jgi:NAD(P)-dependent dehydrogenase (short-subunit alcohol dehydrogenase family)